MAMTSTMFKLSRASLAEVDAFASASSLSVTEVRENFSLERHLRRIPQPFPLETLSQP